MSYPCKNIISLLAIFYVSVTPRVALAFPEFIGSGYHSCKSCHQDFTGGGPLNSYGRSIAGDHLSMFSRAKEGETFYGLVDVSPLDLSGHFRHLSQRYEDDRVRLRQSFTMQKEITLSLTPSEHVSFVGSGGYYGFDPEALEYRRYYTALSFEGLGFRFGRFLPAYGLNIPDHTFAVKDLFGQGDESLNVELSLTTKRFELFLSRILGSNSGIVTTAQPTILQRDDRNGYAFKGSWFVTRGMQLSYSYVTLSDDLFLVKNYSALSFFAGGESLRAYGEVQSLYDESIVAFTRLGATLTQGLWLSLDLDYTRDLTQTFLTLDFYPRPHWHFQGTVSQNELRLISLYYL